MTGLQQDKHLEQAVHQQHTLIHHLAKAAAGRGSAHLRTISLNSCAAAAGPAPGEPNLHHNKPHRQTNQPLGTTCTPCSSSKCATHEGNVRYRPHKVATDAPGSCACEMCIALCCPHVPEDHSAASCQARSSQARGPSQLPSAPASLVP